MTTPLRLTLPLLLALGVGSSASAGPVANLWNGLFGNSCCYSPAPSYYTGYGYGYGYTGYYGGYGYSGCSSCGGCNSCGYGYSYAPSCGGCGSCGACSSCGSCGSCGSCSSCGATGCGGNCIASAPQTSPTPDNPPKTFEEGMGDGDGGYDDNGGFRSRENGAAGDDAPTFEEPEFGTGSREALKPGGEDSTIPMKKEPPTPMPPAPGDDDGAGEETPQVEVGPLRLDGRITWSATARPDRLDVRARYASPKIARTRIAPDFEPDTVHVSTRIAAGR